MPGREMVPSYEKARFLLVYNAMFVPYICDLQRIITKTLTLTSRDESKFRLPPTISKELKFFNDFLYFICHCPVNEDSFSLLYHKAQLLSDDVKSLCLPLIEEAIRGLHQVDFSLTAEVATDSTSLLDMRHNLSHLSVEKAVAAISDECDFLNKGHTMELGRGCTVLKDENFLCSSIKIAKKKLTSNSLQRSKVRREIAGLETLYEEVFRCTDPLAIKLKSVANDPVSDEEIVSANHIIKEARKSWYGKLSAIGKANIKEYWSEISGTRHHLPCWILSGGRELKNSVTRTLHNRIMIHDPDKVIDRTRIIEHVSDILLLTGPPGSGKTEILYTLLQSYLDSREDTFHGISDFEAVLYIPTTSEVCGSFRSLLQERIFKLNSTEKKMTSREDIFCSLGKMKVLYMIDFDCKFSKSVENGIKELVDSMSCSNQLLIACRTTYTQRVETFLFQNKSFYDCSSILPLTRPEVLELSLDYLQIICPRFSIVEEIAKEFSYSLNYDTQEAVLYPLTLAYLLKLWRDERDSLTINGLRSTTEIFHIFYDLAFKSIMAKEKASRLKYPQDVVYSIEALRNIECQAAEGHEGDFPGNPTYNYEPLYPFVVSINVLSSATNQIFYVHSLLKDFLSAMCLMHKLAKIKLWSPNFKKNISTLLKLRVPARRYSLQQTYIFLCSLTKSSSTHLLSLKIETIMYLFSQCSSPESPCLLEWAALLTETGYHETVSSCIRSMSDCNVSVWTPSKMSYRNNQAMVLLIEYSAVLVKEVILSSTEPSLKEILKVVANKPSIKVCCSAGSNNVDKIINRFVDKNNIYNIQGSISEQGATSLRHLKGLRSLDLTILTYEAVVELAQSLKYIKKNLKKVSLTFGFRVEDYQELPALDIGNSKFSLTLDGFNLQRTGIAIRIKKQLGCSCETITINNMRLPSYHSRDLRKALYPTKVFINTIFQHSEKTSPNWIY